MSRPVILVDIGEAGLPEVTPVVPVQASWVPVVYVAPPPPAPSSLAAAPVSDGVLLTWAHVGGRGIEFRIERAPDVAGVPGTWIQVGGTADLRYTATTDATEVDGFWWRVRAVRNGKYSGYTAEVFQWPYASNPPSRDLAISLGTITIDCRYTKFTLLLDQDVNYVAFINVPPTKTVLLYVTQSGGDHLLIFPPWVRPGNNVPFIASPVAGSLDLIGLDTDNGGIDWTLMAVQPAGGGSAFAVTAWPSPAYQTVYCTPTDPASPSVQVTSEQVNGTAPVTCEWSRVDTFGGTDFTLDDDTIAAPTFSVASGVTDYDATQVWRATYSDASGRTVNTTVTIRLVRVVTADEDISAALLNPGFELGDSGWDKGPSCAIVAAYPNSGIRSLQLNTGYYGTSESVNQYVADVAPSQVLTATAMIHQGAGDVGSEGGYVRIKWYSDAGGTVSLAGGALDANGNDVRDGRGGAIHPSTIPAAVVPSGALSARFAIVLYRTAQNYVCNADDCSWARLS